MFLVGAAVNNSIMFNEDIRFQKAFSLLTEFTNKYITEKQHREQWGTQESYCIEKNLQMLATYLFLLEWKAWEHNTFYAQGQGPYECAAYFSASQVPEAVLLDRCEQPKKHHHCCCAKTAALAPVVDFYGLDIVLPAIPMPVPCCEEKPAMQPQKPGILKMFDCCNMDLRPFLKAIGVYPVGTAVNDGIGFMQVEEATENCLPNPWIIDKTRNNTNNI